MRLGTTSWHVVLDAQAQSQKKSAALGTLIERYWRPLYVYVRRRGYSVEDAQDLTQEFFTNLLEKDYIARADRSRGKFRTFLLTSLSNFLANEWDKRSRTKRGGGIAHISMNFEEIDRQLATGDHHRVDPEACYAREWAASLLRGSLEALRSEFEARDDEERFKVLSVFLDPNSISNDYGEAARALDLSEETVRVAVHRLRRRYGAFILEQIEDTVDSPQRAEEELQDLYKALA